MIACIDTPVAPIGWPFAFSPPDGLTGSRPSFAVQPSSTARAPWPGGRQPHRLVFQQLGDGEAVMRFDERQIVEPEARRVQRAAPRLARALERDGSRLRDRQEVVDLHRGTEPHRLAQVSRGLLVRQHQRRGAVGDQRAIGALQRRRDVGVLLAHRAAELEAEVAAHLRVRIVHAVLVVLRRDRRQRVGLVAVALEIALGDAAEHAGEPGRNVALLLR